VVIVLQDQGRRDSGREWAEQRLTDCGDLRYGGIHVGFGLEISLITLVPRSDTDSMCSILLTVVVIARSTTVVMRS
jgi:hypothetical protein